MNYEDRQKYKCLGIGGNKTLLQTIILRVKGRYLSMSTYLQIPKYRSPELHAISSVSLQLFLFLT